MHNHKTARLTTQAVYEAYSHSREKWDADLVGPATLKRWQADPDERLKAKVAMALCRHGFVVTIWNVWEYYSTEFCQTLPARVNRKAGKKDLPLVEWVNQCLTANRRAFPEFAWFKGASALRNLIVHSGGRVVSTRAQSNFAKALAVFPTLEQHTDFYLPLDHETIVDLTVQIESFIDQHAIV